VPQDVLARNLLDVKMQAAVDEADERLRTSPKLAQALRDKPWLAQQSHDDVGTLAQIEQFLRDTGGSAKAGVYNASKGAAGMFRAGAELFAPALDFLEPVTEVGGNPLRRLAEGFDMLAQQNDASAKAVTPKTTGDLSGGFQSGVQSLTQNLLTLPMAFLPGGQPAALAGMVGFTGGNAYQDARDKGLPMSQALPFAASQAAIEYATEKLPLGQLIGDVKAGTALYKMLAKQIALEVPGEQIATVLQDLNEWAVLHPEKPFSAYLEERPSAAAQTLVATIVGVGGNVAVVKGIESVVNSGARTAAQVQEAERGTQQLEAALQTAAQSKLRERNPETFKQLVQQMAEETDGAPTSVFIDAQVLAQAGVNVAEMFPSAADQMDAALASNGMVQIDLGDVLTAVPGTPLEQVFLQNARTSETALSMVEAKQASEQAGEFLKQEADRVMAEAQDQATWQASADTVKTTILEQLNTAGRFTPDVNEAYSTLVRDFYAVTAARLGITPQEMYQRYPLRVGAAGQQGAVLDQGETFTTYRGVSTTGTPNDYGVAGKGEYSSGRKQVAETYAGKGGSVEQRTVTLRNPLKLTYSQLTALQTSLYGQALTGFEEGLSAQFDAYLRQQGYDGVVLFDPEISTTVPEEVVRLSGETLAQSPAAFDGPEQSTTPIGDVQTVNVDGKERTVFNSNGQPIHPTLEGVRNFWRWFGDSKVVDASGKPLVVYHGTNAEFTEFRPTNIGTLGPGIYFAFSREAAQGWADRYKGGRVVEVYLRAENPVEIDSTMEAFGLYDRFAPDGSDKEMVLGLRREGFDAVWAKNPASTSFGDTAPEIAVYDPTQIKSATGNQGTFDPQNPNILNQQARGTFSPSQMLITLGESSDLSTFLHESGHFFLEVMADLASQPNAPAEVQDDMGKLLKWFGITGNEQTGGADSGAPLAQSAQQGYEGSDAGEAREWLAAVAKGLDMSLEARMERAAAMGFDTSRTLYHSTLDDTQAFAPFGKFMGYTGTSGISVTDSAEMASRYLDRFGTTRYDGKPFQKNVIPVFIKPGKILERKDPFPIPPGMRLGAPIPAGYVPAHKKMGYDTLVRDDALSRKGPVKHSDAKNAIRGKEYVLTDPSQVRSIFAAFDPDNAASSNLLAQDGNLPTDNTQPAGRTPLEVWNAMTLDQKRPYHEKFAESFEQYLLEGKAPNTELQPLFRKFRSWMLNVYKSLTQFMRGRDLNLSDDVRQVFDRMLTTDEQIKQAEEAAGLLPNFEATNEAIEKLQARSLRDLKWTVNARSKALKALQKEAATLRKGVEEEVRAEVEAMPEMRAQAELKKLKKPSDIEMATVADSFGYESVDAMLKAIDAFGKKADVIEGMTDQRMLERHGDIATPEAQEAAANEAVHNEARARSLATELKAQSDMINAREQTGTASNGRAITVNALAKAAKEFGANLAARRRVKDLKAAAAQHRAAEARAGKRWQEATAKGKTEEAVQAKRDQVLNNAAVKALQEAQAEVQKSIEFFRRVTKGSDEKIVERGRDPDVVNAMRAILGAYDVAPRLEKGALEYMEIVARNDPVMYAALQPSVQGALMNAKPMGEMTMEELRGLTDELRSMWHLAKRSRQMEVDGNLMDREALADDLVARMQEKGIPDTVPGERGAITPGEEAGIKLQFAKAILSRVEQWAERMDGKFGGPFLRYVFQPVKDAADRYRTARTDYRKRFTALVENVAPALTTGTIDAPELGYKFGNGKDSGSAELLHAILHTGNDSNKRKLLLGRQWATENADGTLDTSRWDAFIQRVHNEGKLTKAHWDFAQGVWDLLEETKPLAQKTHREVFGRYFAEVTANPVATPFGEYRGGYVPAQTDSRLVKDAKLRELAEGENESLAYAFPSAPSGFTKARVDYNKPLLLDLRALAQHMDKVLLFSHMQGPITDARRLLTDKRVSYALDRIDPGAYEGMLIPWLNRSAKQIVETPVAGDRKLSRFLSAARARAGMALMFANLSNTAQQITGFSSAAVKVKPSLILSSLAKFTASPGEVKRAVVEASAYMRDRMQNEVSAMNNVVEEILIEPGLMERGQAWTQKHAYFLQSAVDNITGPIIWTAAYNQAVGQKMEHKDAVRFADGVIRQTQGSTLPEDVSRFETGPAAARIFTQFIGYFNMLVNTNATAAAQIIESMGVRKGAGKLLYVGLAGMLAPIWVAEAIAQAFKGGPDDEEGDGYLDDWLKAVFGLGTLKGLVAMVPIVGQGAQLVVSNFNTNPADDKFSLSPAVSLLESAARAPKSVYDAIVGEGKAQKAVRDVASAATLVTGLPFYAAARPIGYGAGVAAGEIEPTSEADMARGLLTGVATKESKQR
jgi:hypothetical protein